MFGIQADEGEIFINLLFHGILNGSQREIQVTPRLYRRFVEFVFPKSFEKILNKYPPPCQLNNNPECDCAQNMKDILTGNSFAETLVKPNLNSPIILMLKIIFGFVTFVNQ